MTRRTVTKKYRIKSKFRFITAVVIALGLCIGVFGFVSGTNESTALTSNGYTQVEVSDGDTLWEIAENVKTRNIDTRQVVNEICKANDIQAADLQPGMILVIPEYL